MTDSQDVGVTPFPIVGIGASAGGLEAFEAFFRACPADTGMGFVLVPHLDPSHVSLLTEILQRSTAMPVVEALDQFAVAPNHVYVIPPNREMSILNGVLQLHLPEQPRGQRMPIDGFLRALAEDQAERAIGIILSGTATDGTLGLGAIFGAGGVCLVQDPANARYDGMPQSAIAAGYATHILPVEEMPAMLQQLAKRSAHGLGLPAIVPEHTLSGINQILSQLRGATGHDFSLYKKSTIGRRIERRMVQHAIGDLAVYARFLKDNPVEIQALFKELLINVTNFFRDPEAFIALKVSILPRLLAAKPTGSVFRVWVAGCASGEEAYSIAMVLQELLDEAMLTHAPAWDFQIFATDLDDDAIATARAGSYPPNIAQDVTPERLHHFFIKDDAGFKVKKSIREKVVFAVHSVIKDPPFTKLDLLSCRNLLIYLESEQQDRLVPSFHYALNPDGVLFLSSSESIANHPDLFAALDRKWKFYRAKASAPRSVSVKRHDLNWTFMQPIETAVPVVAAGNPRTSNIAELSQRALLKTFAPTSVTTDLQGNILYVHGDAGRYLRPPPGPISTQVVEMACAGMQLELRAALLAAASKAKPTLNRVVSLPGDDGDSRTVSLSVRPLPRQAGDGENLLLVSFQDVPSTSTARRPRGKGGKNGEGGKGGNVPASADALRVGELEREVAYARENLQSTIEAQQASNEELKSANEELQSTNEELQSTNEEMETSKEELQSLNEEVLTMNSELNAKVEQLSGIQNDMKNLLDNINTGTLFLDHQLAIRRYTREALKIYPLIASDIGRPLADIQSNFDSQSLLTELQTVLDTLVPKEREVRTADGKWYLARIQPYRTLDNVIEGVVLTFTEVTDFKLLSDAVQRNEAILATAQEIAHLGSWELDLDTGRAHWSDEMFKLFGYPVSSQPMVLEDVLKTLSEEDRARVKAEMHNAVTQRTPYDLRYQVTRQDGTQREIRSRALPIADASGRITRLVGTSLDVTP